MRATTSRLIQVALALQLMAMMGVGCISSEDPHKHAKEGALIGAGIGAAAGAVIGNQSGNPRTGAVVGAAVGAAAGTLVGAQKDKMEAELRRIQELEVRREAENRIRVILSNAILFDVDSSILKASARNTLDRLADVLVSYPETTVLVVGHTDSTGSEEYNLRLSERRAQTVMKYLITRGVDPARISAMGMGESLPIASNDTPEGRARNRRVEIEVRFQ